MSVTASARRRPAAGDAASFEAVLDSLSRKPSAGERPRLVEVPLGWDGEPAAINRWGEQAFAEFALSAEPAAPPSDDVEAIRAELQRLSGADGAGWRRARRQFMWANHPDRRQDLPPALANRRVAIANMLIDQAMGAQQPLTVRGRAPS